MISCGLLCSPCSAITSGHRLARSYVDGTNNAYSIACPPASLNAYVLRSTRAPVPVRAAGGRGCDLDSNTSVATAAVNATASQAANEIDRFITVCSALTSRRTWYATPARPAHARNVVRGRGEGTSRD